MMNHNAIAADENEYTAIQAGRAVVELANWTRIRVTGADRQTFLHNFCTNDVKRLQPSQACEAFFTNVKGKVLGHGLITCREQELVVVGEPGQAMRLIEHLDRYVMREDVQFHDTTSEWSHLLVVGSRSTGTEPPSSLRPPSGSPHPSENSLHPRSDETLPNSPPRYSGEGQGEGPSELAEDHMPDRCAKGGTRELPWPTFAWDLVGRDDARLVECRRHELPLVQRTLAEQGFVPVGSQAFATARIEASVPLFGVDFDDRNLPQEVGRNQQAISFTKGCYLGQETVARIDALGHVNQQIAGVRFPGNSLPSIGDTLTVNGDVAGHVTSATFSPRLRAPLALAMLRREPSRVGSRLDSPVGGCEVVALPL